MEEYFDNIRIEDQEDLEENENDEAIDDFIKNMDKKMDINKWFV